MSATLMVSNDGMRICPQCQGRTAQRSCPEDGYQTVDEQDLEDSLVGTVFDERYRIDEVLGRGGMGAVYCATQLAVNRPVALKVMRTDMVSDLKAIARFQQEARAIAALTHPNTIRLIDFGHAQGKQLFLVMEYLQGESLGTLLRREGPLSPVRLVTIATQILESLSEAHAHGIVHRDMKPENVFVTHVHGKKDFIKVLDFGIAKLTSSIAGESPHTSAGIALGSPRYMAPEQACAQPATPQADIYAVGVMMYQMLTGSVPFSGDNIRAVILAHIRQAPPAPSRDAVLLDGGLVQLIMRCLAKQPAERPDGADQVIEQLETLRRDPKVGVYPAESQSSLMEATLPLQAPVVATQGSSEDPAVRKESGRSTLELSTEPAGQTLSLHPKVSPTPESKALGRPQSSEKAEPGTPEALHTPGAGLLAEKDMTPRQGTQGAWWRRMAIALTALLVMGVAGFVTEQWLRVDDLPAGQGYATGSALGPMPLLRIAPNSEETTRGANASPKSRLLVSTAKTKDALALPPSTEAGPVTSVSNTLKSADSNATVNRPSTDATARIPHEVRVVTEPSGAKVRLGKTNFGLTPVIVRWTGMGQGRHLDVSLKAHRKESILLSTLVGKNEVRLQLRVHEKPMRRKSQSKRMRRSTPNVNAYEALP